MVQVSRDGWDWVSLFAGLGLFATGIVTFGFWFLQIRRRPEADIAWSYSWEGHDGPYTDWAPKDGLELPVERCLYIRVNATNCGDAPAANAMTNIVVPECLDLTRHATSTAPGAVAGADNRFVGEPPGYAVRYMVNSSTYWDVGLSWTHYVTVRAPKEACPIEQELRLMFELAHSALNSSGKRLTPSLIPPPSQLTRDSPLVEPLHMRWIKAQAHVYRRRGSRTDHRTVRVLP